MFLIIVDNVLLLIKTNTIQLKYLEISIPVHREIQEILIAYLSEIEYDGFWESKKQLTAYIEEGKYDEDALKEKLGLLELDQFDVKKMKDENWNAKWEENFPTTLIDETIQIRAPFHESKGWKHEILIEPKMSFGTGHHATTYQVCKGMLSIDFKNKNVLDLGAGTGILAILAKQLGANKIKAVDFDPWSIENMVENFERNDAAEIETQQADLSDLSVVNSIFEAFGKADVVLANINRNLLLEIIPCLSKLLAPNSILVTSGYIKEDEHHIVNKAGECSFNLISRSDMNNWMTNTFEKQ